ncbi:hypothetical protein FRC00_007067, partial [Tulasnella sp. 408]
MGRHHELPADPRETPRFNFEQSEAPVETLGALNPAIYKDARGGASDSSLDLITMLPTRPQTFTNYFPPGHSILHPLACEDFRKINMSAPRLRAGPSLNTRSRAKRKHDNLVEASLPPGPETTEETQPLKKINTGKPKIGKLPARGLELLAALLEKRMSVTDIEFNEEISQDGGTFADVVAATLVTRSFGQPRRRVAVKKLRFISSMTEEKFFCGFVNELRLLDRLSHPNIVKIIGFVEDMENRIVWLVFPWEDNGNLRKFLRSGMWDVPERVSLIEDVALGLEYLHSRQPPICHGDLKS